MDWFAHCGIILKTQGHAGSGDPLMLKFEAPADTRSHQVAPYLRPSRSNETGRQKSRKHKPKAKFR
jgi:hypothetical protein